jgi:hypothetical protein
LHAPHTSVRMRASVEDLRIAKIPETRIAPVGSHAS